MLFCFREQLPTHPGGQWCCWLEPQKCWLTNGYANGTLVNGTKDSHLVPWWFSFGTLEFYQAAQAAEDCGRCADCPWSLNSDWANYNDLTQPHPKWWFMCQPPYFRLVKYYHSPGTLQMNLKTSLKKKPSCGERAHPTTGAGRKQFGLVGLVLDM